MTTSYATLAQVKLQCGIPIADTTDDLLIQAALDATTTKINEKTGQLGSGFFKDVSASPRYFKARHPELLTVDSIADVTGLTVKIGNSGQPSSFTTTVDPQSYETLPENNLVYGKPVTALRSLYAVWPTYPYVSLQVTAIWGWPAVPANVVTAQYMWAAKLWRRKDSVDGIAGQNGYGAMRVPPMDPDIEAMLFGDETRPGFA